MLLAFLLGLTLMVGVRASFGATTLLPNGEQCFQTGAGPVASGSVYMLIPSTTTPKNTYQDSGQTVLNTNPIQLDANGCAVIYGTGSYRQQLFSGPVVSGLPTGTMIYDQLTADTSSYQNVFWAGLSAGTANVITVVDAGFNFTDGSIINFLALNTNTTSTTLNVSGTGAFPIKIPSTAGPVNISAGQITANNPVSVVWSSSANAFLLLTGVPTAAGGTGVASSGQPPGGYLTLVSDATDPIQTTDQTGATAVYYTPYVSNQIPVWNGTGFTQYSFSQLQLTLTGSHAANTIYDVCAFINNSAVTLATGPAWSVSTAGSGARGTGAGTAQLQRQSGIYVNAVAMTGLNGGNTYNIAALQCTYVGSILIDSSAGTVSNNVGTGGSRKWSVFNAYNRLPVSLEVSDSTPSWTYNSASWRQSHGSSTNIATTLTGLAEERVSCKFNQNLAGSAANADKGGNIAIGVNSATPSIGTIGSFGVGIGSATDTVRGDATIEADVVLPPSLGSNTFQSLEAVIPNLDFSGGNPTTGTFVGSPQMLLQCGYRG